MAYKNKNIDIIPNDYKLNFNNVTGTFRNNISPLEPGVSHGYIAGGFTNTAPPVPPPYSSYGASITSNINKFNFAAKNDALSVADLTVLRADAVGNSSPTHGYNSGGLERAAYSPSSPPQFATSYYPPYRAPTPYYYNITIVQSTNTVDKHSFGTTVTSVDVGDLTQARHRSSGASSSSHGYVSGGLAVAHPGAPSPPLNTTVNNSNIIDKFPFSSDANSSDVGDLTTSLNSVAGQQSSANGYSVGGTTGQTTPLTHLNVIEKFPFASDANSSNISDLTVARSSSSGHFSSTHGYTSGGDIQSPPYGNPTPSQMSDTIDKFPFASDDNATDVGDLNNVTFAATGLSSPTEGFAGGGTVNMSSYPTRGNIYHWPFASDANSSQFFGIASPRGGGAGTQGG